MSLDERLKSVAQAYLSMHEKNKMDPVDKDELKGKHADRDDKDIDNDGDVDGSDKYLHKKRKAISKAINDDKRQFVAAAVAAKEKGEKKFTFAGKEYDVKETLNKEAVEVEVDKDSEASPEMKKKPMPKGKAKAKKKVDDKDDKEAETNADMAEGVDTSPAGNSPPAKAIAARDKEILDQAKKDTKADKRRDEDKQDGSNAVKESPKRHNDSKVGEKVMKKFKDMR